MVKIDIFQIHNCSAEEYDNIDQITSPLLDILVLNIYVSFNLMKINLKI